MTSIAKYTIYQPNIYQKLNLLLGLLLLASSAGLSKVSFLYSRTDQCLDDWCRRNSQFQVDRDGTFVRTPSHTACSHPIMTTSYSFLDIGPLSRGHALVIPKCLYHKFVALNIILNDFQITPRNCMNYLKNIFPIYCLSPRRSQSHRD